METYTWQDVPGWFEYKDFYDKMIEKFPNGSKFVEVGTYYGKSCIYLASAIRLANKNISIDAIDSFNNPLFPISGGEKMFRHFAAITGTDKLINLIIADQLDAASRYEDKSLDMVFLDADHSYKGTADAISAFLPKIKSGGIIAGDDYDVIGFANVVKAVNAVIPQAIITNRVFAYEVP